MGKHFKCIVDWTTRKWSNKGEITIRCRHNVMCVATVSHLQENHNTLANSTNVHEYAITFQCTKCERKYQTIGQLKSHDFIPSDKIIEGECPSKTY